jgi:hypothetical protein
MITIKEQESFILLIKKNIRAILKMANIKEKEHFIFLMATSMREISKIV